MRTALILFGVLLLPTDFALALDRVPPDSIIAMLNDRCDQERQLNAVYAISAYGRGWVGFESDGGNRKPIKITPEYNRPDVKAAYKEFVLSLVFGDVEERCGSRFNGSYYLGFRPREDADYEGSETDLDLVLGIYLYWGFRDNLYQVADAFIARDTYPSKTFIVLLNSLGRGYFDHLRDVVVSYPENTISISTVQKCLLHEELLDSTNRKGARVVIRAALASKNVKQRSMAIQSDESRLWCDIELRDDLLSVLRNEINDTFAVNGYNYGLDFAWRLYYPIKYNWGLDGDYWKVLMLADSIIEVRATSSDPRVRMSAAGAALMACEAGKWGLKRVVKRLLHDSDPEVQNYVKTKIKEYQSKWDFEENTDPPTH